MTRKNGAAARAWKRHVVGCSSKPSRWAELAEEFARELPARSRERALAALLLCLAPASDWESLLDGAWLGRSAMRRYMHLEAPGYGDARMFALLTKFVRWLRAKERLNAAQLARLVSRIDDGSESVGSERKNGTRRDFVFHDRELEPLVQNFARSVKSPFEQGLAGAAVSVLIAHVRVGAEHARFGDLDVTSLVISTLAPEQERECHNVIDASRTLLSILAQFYRWLGGCGYLEAARAEDLSRALGMFAFRAAA